MNKLLALLITLPLFYSPFASALVINSQGVAAVEDFTGFSGSGFSATPGAGQLDSEFWRVNGLSDGPGSFGGTHDSGDFARGSDSDGVSGGGIWSFDVDNGPGTNAALGVQPIGADFTPGDITLKVLNGTANTLSSLMIAYDVFIFNDASRASAFNFSFSLDDSDYTAIDAADVISAQEKDAAPQWMENSRSILLEGLNILDSSLFYLRWSGGDAGGLGSRDQFALDNISVTGLALELPPDIPPDIPGSLPGDPPGDITVNIPEPQTWLLMLLPLLLLYFQNGGRKRG